MNIRNRSDTPEGGDFASYLENKHSLARASTKGTWEPVGQPLPRTAPGEQTIQDVLVHGEEPTDAFLETLHALHNAPDLSCEELERQALEAAGEDGYLNTPE
jgi:hypothetical protein